jgi:hypothetical protein
VTIEDDLVDELRSRQAKSSPHEHRPPVTFEELAHAESLLGFRLPALLRRIYTEVADGPRFSQFLLFSVSAADASRDDLVGSYAAVTDPGGSGGEEWPERLLPFAELHRSWVCVDCRSDDGLVVVESGENDQFMTNDRTLTSWFRASLTGVDLRAEVFEPDEVKSVRNPFTGRTEVRTVRGRPRGRRWP